jgi:uncharacterized membrane protein
VLSVTRSQRLLAAFFTFAGAMHFLRPRDYRAMVPPYVPRHHEAVVISGVAEIAGGLAVIPSRSRRFARWWLLALLAAVFPANVDMAAYPERHTALRLERLPRWVLWARLPLQFVAAAWVWRATEE